LFAWGTLPLIGIPLLGERAQRVVCCIFSPPDGVAPVSCLKIKKITKQITSRKIFTLKMTLLALNENLFIFVYCSLKCDKIENAIIHS